jgi:hypothetical protein
MQKLHNYTSVFTHKNVPISINIVVTSARPLAPEEVDCLAESILMGHCERKGYDFGNYELGDCIHTQSDFVESLWEVGTSNEHTVNTFQFDDRAFEDFTI